MEAEGRRAANRSPTPDTPPRLWSRSLQRGWLGAPQTAAEPHNCTDTAYPSHGQGKSSYLGLTPSKVSRAASSANLIKLEGDGV